MNDSENFTKQAFNFFIEEVSQAFALLLVLLNASLNCPPCEKLRYFSSQLNI